MIEGLRPYPSMQDSGVPWVPTLPVHWGVSGVKRLAQSGYKTFVDGDWIESPFIRSEGIRLIQTGNIGTGSYREKGFRYIDENTFNEFGCTEFQPNDVLICRLGEPVGRACLAPRLGVRMITSVDVCILKPREDVVGAYVVYAMSSPQYLGWVDSLVRGSTRDRVSRSMLGSFPIPLPPRSEQVAIVQFLDHADARIRRYIRAKQKLIKLLEEEKQAIIHSAVTRGLAPNVRLKPSGVKLAGDIPEHWESKRGKYYFREIDERSASGAEELMSVSHKTGVTARSEKNITMFMAESYVGHKLCRPGDIAVNTMWAWMAAVGVSSKVGIVSPSYGVYRPRNEADFRPAYLDMLLRTEAYRSEYLRNSRGITTSRLRLYPDDFLGILFIRPPLNEQDDILRQVKHDTDDLRRTIDNANREIALLREWRCSLIADVVIGRLDVREAAPKLPQDLPELETLDEMDDPVAG